MLAEWLSPLCSWLGVSFIGLLLIIIILILIFKD